MLLNPTNIASYLIVLLPLSLITGPFFSDLSVVIIDLIFFYFIIKNKQYKIFNNNLFKFLLLFNIYISIRSIFTDDIFLSLKSSLPYFRFLILIFAINYFLNKNKNLINHFSKSIIVIIIILCLDALFQYIFGFNTLGFKIDNPDKLNGFFGDEAVLGSYLIRLFPLFIASYFIVFNKKENKFLFISIFSLISITIFFSGSRSSIALLFLFITIFLLLFKSFRKEMLTLLISVVILLGLSSTLSEKIRYNINYNLFDPIRTIFFQSKKSRTENVKDKKIIIFTQVYHTHYETAYNMFKNNKFFGVGNKMYRKLCSEKEYNINKFSCTTHPHNFYIQVLAENGFFGFIFIISLFTYCSLIIFKEIYFRNIKKENNLDDKSVLILTGVFLNLWPIIPSGNLYNNWLSILIYLPIGFYFYFYKKDNV